MSDLRALGEFGLIARLTQGLPESTHSRLGLGDDCAVLQLGDRQLLITTDASVEGTHFDFRWLSHEDAGWRAMAGAISDIAAMGGTPLGATVSLALPKDMPLAQVDALYAGLRGAAAAAETAIIGGDTTRSPGPIFIDITVLGEATDGQYVSRAGAKPGDVLAVTGWPGRSAAALAIYQRGGTPSDLLAQAHCRPLPRLAAGRWLARRAAVHAMIDVSDGVLQDAGHLAKCSGLGLETDTNRPIDDAALLSVCAGNALNPSHCFWSGGEDYELAIAVEAEHFEKLRAAFEAEVGLRLHAVGHFTAEPQPQTTGGAGFDHFAST